MVKPKLREEPELKWDRNGHKYTIIETEQGAKYCDMPLKDFDLLMDLYDSLPHPKFQTPQWDFVLNINWRIYTEWCMTPEGNNYQKYHAKGFKNFIREETHMELVRGGYQWNVQEKRFENINDEQYQQARQRVLGGLVVKAIELFSDWEGTSPHPTDNNPRNLRGSLTDYIAKFNSLKQPPQPQEV